MAMAMDREKESPKSAWMERIKLAATIVGIVSFVLALATFIGFKPEKSKALVLEYISKSTLINRSAAGEKIEVTYSGRKIAQLTAISARLVNSGSLPIDSSDVKDDEFPKLIFASNILNFEIKSRNPDAIKANAAWETNIARIVHGLLNPGDALNLQILIEGDPGEITNLPKISYRISGIKEPRTLYPSLSTQQPSVACFRFSTTMEYFIMGLASFSPILMLFVLAAGVSEAIRGAFPDKRLMANVTQIRKRIDMNASGKKLQDLTANAFYIGLQKPYDDRARSLIGGSMPLATETSTEYVERMLSEVRNKVFPQTVNQRINAVGKGAILGILVVSFLCVASTLITIGSWRILISLAGVTH